MVLIDTNHRCTADEIYIEMLGVAPEWRGRGVARRLMRHASAMAQLKQMRRLTLEVASDNRPAIGLYRKMGFEIQSDHRSRLLNWITGHPGFYQMEKQIG